jgi:hypothetical protein
MMDLYITNCNSSTSPWDLKKRRSTLASCKMDFFKIVESITGADSSYVNENEDTPLLHSRRRKFFKEKSLLFR